MLGFGMPQGAEWLIILVIALLLFGRRLPEVARSVGRGIVEFKKGVKGIEDEVDSASAEARKPLLEADSRAMPRQPLATPAQQTPADGAAH